MVSFVDFSVECPFYKFYGINCRPELGAKLLDRFFHRRRQVSPSVNNLTHRFFNGCYHLFDGDLAVSLHHSPTSLSDCSRQDPALFWWRLRGLSAEAQFANGIVSSVSFLPTTKHREELGRLRLACIGAHGCFTRYFTGIRTGASLSLSKTTKNLAGIVSLALRPTV